MASAFVMIWGTSMQTSAHGLQRRAQAFVNCTYENTDCECMHHHFARKRQQNKACENECDGTRQQQRDCVNQAECDGTRKQQRDCVNNEHHRNRGHH